MATAGEVRAERSVARIEGPRVYLRELLVDDVSEAYLRWMNDKDVVRELESRFVTHSLGSLRQFVANVSADPDSVLFGIILREGGRHIGNIKLGPVSRPHATADIGLLIGEKDCWGCGYATEAISLICGFAFTTWKLRKVTASCYETNVGSSRSFEKAGFAREGVRPEQFLGEIGPVGQVMFGLLRKNAGL